MHTSTKDQGKLFIAWRLTVALGVILSVAGLFLMPVFPSTSFAVTEGYGGPVFAFEVASTAQDLIDVFGPAEDPERASRISMMDTGNKWDFGFMLVYALFMAAFFYSAFLTNRKPIYLTLIAVAITSGVMDAVENIILLEITSNLDHAPGLSLLAYPVWAKFFSIMICIAGAGVFIASKPGNTWRVAGVMTIVSSLSILMAFIVPESLGWLIRHGVTVGWLIMLGYASKMLAQQG